MGSSRVVVVLKGLSPPVGHFRFTTTKFSSSSPSKLLFPLFSHHKYSTVRNWSTKAATDNNNNGSSLPPPDVSALAETARISLTPQEVEEFGPKIRQVIDWFGQLQAVDLNSVDPTIRADTEGDNLRDDIPETFDKREAIISGIPSYEEPYVKVPPVLNKE